MKVGVRIVVAAIGQAEAAGAVVTHLAQRQAGVDQAVEHPVKRYPVDRAGQSRFQFGMADGMPCICQRLQNRQAGCRAPQAMRGQAGTPVRRSRCGGSNGS